MLNETFNKMLLESDQAFKELQKLVKSDKELSKKKDVDFMDAFYTKYEKDIEKIVKKYNLDWDTLGSLLMKL